MILEERNGLRILKSEDGFKLYNKNDVNPAYSEIIYLGKKDSQDNYKEIAIEDIPEENNE